LTLNDISNNIIPEKLVYGMINIRPLIRLFTIITILIIALSSNCFANVRFVSKTGSSTPPYLTWETASDSIQKCINTCSSGDTVYVANGVYKETLVVNKSIALIGLSPDSTILDGRGLNGILTSYLTIDVQADCSIENFHVYGRDINALILLAAYEHQVIINNCFLENAYVLLNIGNNSSRVINTIGKNFSYNFAFISSDDTSKPEISNCLISAPPEAWEAIHIDWGGNSIIRNNLIFLQNNSYGILIDGLINSAIIENNLIYGVRDFAIKVLQSKDSVKIFNNNIVNYLPNNAIGLYIINPKASIKNNILQGLSVGIELTGVTSLAYNLFWKNNYDLTNLSQFGPGNIIADPMFVKDTNALSGKADYHLQAYSPAIDKGDSSILDKDGTRSDIGMYGGPWGEKYEYRDLAPRPPHGLDVLADSGKIYVRWNRNTEADFKNYKLYRDTVQHFTADTTKLISIQADTMFIQVPQVNWKKYYYKLTAEDNQGNVSGLSEEIGIITGINDKPQMVSEYRLFQNYPNPFNPTTKIGYRLKESGYVKVMVYDIKGSLLRVLVNETKRSGFYETEFNAKGLASGIYLYRIEVIGKGNIPVFSDMKKLVLLK
jgi:hypothetical protein